MLLSGFGFGHIRRYAPFIPTLSALRFILSAKSEHSCSQDCETVDLCNSLLLYTLTLLVDVSSSCVCSLCWWMFLSLVYAHFASGYFLLLCTLTLLADISFSCVRSLCSWMFPSLVYAHFASGYFLLLCTLTLLVDVSSS